MGLFSRAVQEVKAVLAPKQGLTMTLRDAEFFRWLGLGSDSYAGKTVTTDTALQLSTVWACVRLISQTWGTLPVEVRVWDPKKNGSVPDRDHPLYALLHDQPNADMSAVEFWSAMGVSLMTWGNAYAEINRVYDRVVALTPLQPSLMQVDRGPSGALRYRYADGANRREIPEDDVLHIKGLTLDGICGLSPISQARHSMGLAMAADEVAGKLFANGMRTDGHYTVPTFLTEAQRVQARAMLDGFKGAQAAGLRPLLEGGMTFSQSSLNPEDAELLATREFEIAEICRWYGVPPWMVGHTEKSTSWGTGLESQMLAFYALTLRPVLKNAEQAIRRKLLTPGERGRIEVDFNVEGLLRSDSQGRAEFLQKLVTSGIMTPNEARAKEGLPPLVGGDSLITQSNQMPLNGLGAATSRADLPGAGATTQREADR